MDRVILRLNCSLLIKIYRFFTSKVYIKVQQQSKYLFFTSFLRKFTFLVISLPVFYTARALGQRKVKTSTISNPGRFGPKSFIYQDTSDPLDSFLHPSSGHFESLVYPLVNVTPIFKKCDKSLAANYRPISITCILCKVLKHILASNIVRHLDE